MIDHPKTIISHRSKIYIYIFINMIHVSVFHVPQLRQCSRVLPRPYVAAPRTISSWRVYRRAAAGQPAAAPGITGLTRTMRNFPIWAFPGYGPGPVRDRRIIPAFTIGRLTILCRTATVRADLAHGGVHIVARNQTEDSTLGAANRGQ